MVVAVVAAAVSRKKLKGQIKKRLCGGFFPSGSR